MLPFIEKLRAKPEKTRSRIAFMMSFTFAGLLFVVWLSVIWPEWKTGHYKTSEMAENQATVTEPTPIETLSSTFSTAAGILSNQVSDVKNALSSLATTTGADATSTDSQDKMAVGSSTPETSGAPMSPLR